MQERVRLLPLDSQSYAIWLDGFIADAAQHGHAEQAARLAGAIDAVSAVFPMRRTPYEQAIYEDAVAMAHKQLAPSVFETAWITRRAMSAD